MFYIAVVSTKRDDVWEFLYQDDVAFHKQWFWCVGRLLFSSSYHLSFVLWHHLPILLYIFVVVVVYVSSVIRAAHRTHQTKAPFLYTYQPFFFNSRRFFITLPYNFITNSMFVYYFCCCWVCSCCFHSSSFFALLFLCVHHLFCKSFVDVVALPARCAYHGLTHTQRQTNTITLGEIAEQS